MLVLTHGPTRLPQIPSESLCLQWIQWTPLDYFPTLLLSKNQHFRFHHMTRLPLTQMVSDSTPSALGFVNWNLVESIGHVCSSVTALIFIGLKNNENDRKNCPVRASCLINIIIF